MAKIDVINKIKAIAAGIFLVNEGLTVPELDKLEAELNLIPGFADSELAKAIAHSISEEKKNAEATIASINEERASLEASLNQKISELEAAMSELSGLKDSQSEKIADLETTVSELNESLAKAESNGDKVKTLKPTFTHKKEAYEVLSKCIVFVDGEYKEFSAEQIAENKEVQAILVETQSGVINKLEG